MKFVIKTAEQAHVCAKQSVVTLKQYLMYIPEIPLTKIKNQVQCLEKSGSPAEQKKSDHAVQDCLLKKEVTTGRSPGATFFVNNSFY